MARYLHYYENEPDFQAEYYDEGGINSFVCSAGTFTYDGYEDPIYYWKNGDKELLTPWRDPKVGAWDYNAGTGAWDDDNDTGVEITSVGEIEPGKYVEPWVSAHEGHYIDFIANIAGQGEKAQRADYVGNVDIYYAPLG